MNAEFHTKHKMPIVFFTQLMGLAFGLDPKKMGFGRELTSAKQALKKIGKVPAVEAEVAPVHRPRPDKRALPMPRMLDEAPAGETPAEVAR